MLNRGRLLPCTLHKINDSPIEFLSLGLHDIIEKRTFKEFLSAGESGLTAGWSSLKKWLERSV
jgi:hypothetical protein